MLQQCEIKDEKKGMTRIYNFLFEIGKEIQVCKTFLRMYYWYLIEKEINQGKKGIDFC